MDGEDLETNGEEAAPWKTWAHALKRLAPGDTLTVKDGTWTNDGCAPGEASCYSSEDALPNIDCGAEGSVFAHGHPEYGPITIRAENERRVELRSNGDTPAFALKNCEWWVVEGLWGNSRDFDRELDSDPDQVEDNTEDGPSVFDFSESRHLVVRRLLANNNNRFQNTHLIVADDARDSLFEENEGYSHHRHGFSAVGAEYLVVRRNYFHSRDHADICRGRPSHEIANKIGDESIVFYFADHNVAENNIVERSEGIQASGSLNRLLGNIVIDSVFAFRSTSNCQPQGDDQLCTENLSLYAQANELRDNIAIASATAAFDCDSSRECSIEQSTAFDAQHYSFLHRDRLNIPGYDTTFTTRNSLAVDGGFTGFQVEGLPEGYEPVAEWEGDLLNGFAMRKDAFRPVGGNPEGTWSRAYEIDPELGNCRVSIPRESPMWLADGGVIGAQVLYRYQDGFLTHEPLWHPYTGEFPCGAIVPGVNDVVGKSCFDVHKRLNVNRNGCDFPEGYGAGVWFVSAPPRRTAATEAQFEIAIDGEAAESFLCALDGGNEVDCTDPSDSLSGYFEATNLAPGKHTLEAWVVGTGNTRSAIHRWTVDVNPPSSFSARDVDHHTVELRFDEPVSAVPSLSELSICPSSSGHGCIDIASVEHMAIDRGRRVRLHLERSMVPVEYEVVVGTITDTTGHTTITPLSRTFTPAGIKVAFVTAASGSGDLGSWPSSGGATGVEAGDAICAAEAAAAGLEGQFRAWLSDTNDDAYCRVGNTDGSQESCIAEPTGPWIRVDGFPFSPNLTSIRDDGYGGYPHSVLELDAFGALVEPANVVWTGTTVDGREQSDEHCNGWTDVTGQYEGRYGDATRRDEAWTVRWKLGCSSSNEGRLYCLQSDSGGWPLPSIDHPQYRSTGSRVFVTQTAYDLAALSGGLPAADALCAEAALDLALEGQFVAWMSDSVDDAYCRISGGSGKRDDGCVAIERPFVRLDGVAVAASLAELTDGRLQHPISLAPSGIPVARTGTQEDGKGTNNCNDWDPNSSSSLGAEGWVSGVEGWSARANDTTCEDKARLYCIELEL